MKKIVALLLFVFTLPLGVFADVIYEPAEDDFYWAHQDECVLNERAYIAASSGDAVNIYRSPQDGTVVNTVPNGDEIYSTWRWNDWYQVFDGWIHSDDVSLIYDSEQFILDKIEERAIHQYTGEQMSIPTAQLYTYPNSGDSYELVEDKDYALIGASFVHSYIDEEGREWGYITYYMLHSGWVCVDDATNTSFDSGAVPTEQSVSQQRGSDAVPGQASVPILLIIASVLVVAVVALTLLLILRKKKTA